ncbi:MAG: DUF3299 domain-containing protein [Alphaproteobacteria bacterium]
MIALLLVASPAFAISVEDMRSMMQQYPLPEVSKDSTPWQLFARTGEQQKKVTYPDGGYSYEVYAKYPEEIKALDGKEITLQGYVFPLEESATQSHFLFGPYPPSCPFHYHTPPSLVIEVFAKEPVTYSWDMITIRGTFEIPEAGQGGAFYILRSAATVKN